MRISDWSSDVCSSDLVQGNLYFTDQGQTGLHDPSGRVYRLRPSGQLDLLLSNGPSPNGIALDPSGHVLYMAMTRANAVWRAPVLADGSLSKVGAFRTFFGASGPGGLAVDATGRSEEHTSVLQSLMRTSYAVLCLKKN